MKTIAIIPARGGSKRLPNKNTNLLGGLPLIVHSINFAKENHIDKIVMSTDDEFIKEIALHNGAEVMERFRAFATNFLSIIYILKTGDRKVAGN